MPSRSSTSRSGPSRPDPPLPGSSDQDRAPADATAAPQGAAGPSRSRRTRPSRAAFAPHIAGAVAVGSTSVHLEVGVVAPHGFEPITDESVILELGEIADRQGAITPAALQELIGTLRRYQAVATSFGATELTVVATEPIRRARNAVEVLTRVREETGLLLQLLSHGEEGYLAMLAVTHAQPPGSDLLIVDIGGGSSEYVLLGPERGPEAYALKVGAARLTRPLVHHDPPLASEIELLRAEARRHLGTAADLAPRQVVFIGGTASNLVKLVPAASIDMALDRRRIAAAFRVLAGEASEATAARFGIRPTRARILAGGAALVEAFLERYRMRHGLVSEASIREGVVLAAAYAGAEWRTRLHELARGWSG